MPLSSIADSGRVLLGTYIKIIVICRGIIHTLRKLKQLTEKYLFILFIYLLANTRSTLRKFNGIVILNTIFGFIFLTCPFAFDYVFKTYKHRSFPLNVFNCNI